MGEKRTYYELVARVAELEEIVHDVSCVHLRGSHIEVESITYGDVTVSLDAAGNAVDIDFATAGWEAE